VSPWIIFFFHCDAASALWSSLFNHFGLSWAMSRRVIGLLASWWSSGRPRSAAVWKMAPICLFWYLWRKMNNRSFEDLERSLEENLSSFYHKLYLWSSAYVYPLSFSFNAFLLVFLFLLKCFLCILPMY
jgi:hypothetical protein